MPSAGAFASTSTPALRARSRELARVRHAALGEQPPARLGALVGEHDVGTELRRLRRRAQAGGPTPDHEDVGVTAAVLGAPLALGLRLAQLPEPGRVTKELLVQRPEATWPDEGLVVEAGRGERAAEEVGGAHHVEVERRLRVHVLDLHALADRLGAGAHAGSAVDRDEAVGALAGAAEQAAAAVVLERAREGALAAGEERRPDRVPLEPGDLTPVERERDLRVTVDALAALLGQAAHVQRGRRAGREHLVHRARPVHLVRARVALRDEPFAAAGAVQPPLLLHSGDVAAEVVVLARARGGWGRSWDAGSALRRSAKSVTSRTRSSGR